MESLLAAKIKINNLGNQLIEQFRIKISEFKSNFEISLKAKTEALQNKNPRVDLTQIIDQHVNSCCEQLLSRFNMFEDGFQSIRFSVEEQPLEVEDGPLRQMQFNSTDEEDEENIQILPTEPKLYLPTQQSSHQTESRAPANIARKYRSTEESSEVIAKTQCGVCGKRLEDAISLGIHMREQHPRQTNEQSPVVTCHYQKYSKLQPHTLQYTCSECQYVVHGMFWKYRMHLKEEHNKTEWFTCIECPQSFDDVAQLAQHIFKSHAVNVTCRKDRYTCRLTRLSFDNAREIHPYLLEHMAYHRQVPNGFEKYKAR